MAGSAVAISSSVTQWTVKQTDRRRNRHGSGQTDRKEQMNSLKSSRLEKSFFIYDEYANIFTNTFF